MNDKLQVLAKQIIPKITNEVVNDKLVITLSGPVRKAYSWEKNGNSINEKEVRNLIDGSEQDIVIKLNSQGGDVFEGISLYNYLKGLKNHVTIEVTALAASAASIIAMAGDEVVMCTGSQMMVHEASTVTWGNKTDIKKTLNALETIDSSLATVYENKTKQDLETINDWINGETWFTAQEAVEKGLADRVDESEPDEEPENIETSWKRKFDDKEMINQLVIEAVNEHLNKVEPKNEPKTLFQKFIKKGANK